MPPLLFSAIISFPQGWRGVLPASLQQELSSLSTVQSGSPLVKAHAKAVQDAAASFLSFMILFPEDYVGSPIVSPPGTFRISKIHCRKEHLTVIELYKQVKQFLL